MNRAELIALINEFQSTIRISDTAIGQIALNDGKFVARLRKGRRVWPETAQKVADFLEVAATMQATNDGTEITVTVYNPKTDAKGSGRTLAEAYAALRSEASAKVAA